MATAVFVETSVYAKHSTRLSQPSSYSSQKLDWFNFVSLNINYIEYKCIKIVIAYLWMKVWNWNYTYVEMRSRLDTEKFYCYSVQNHPVSLEPRCLKLNCEYRCLVGKLLEAYVYIRKYYWIDFRKIRCEVINRIELTQDRDQWQIFL
jgi:hypothetical protein